MAEAVGKWHANTHIPELSPLEKKFSDEWNERNWDVLEFDEWPVGVYAGDESYITLDEFMRLELRERARVLSKKIYELEREIKRMQRLGEDVEFYQEYVTNLQRASEDLYNVQKRYKEAVYAAA